MVLDAIQNHWTCASAAYAKSLAVITSWEAPSRKITVESAVEMARPAGWSEGSINLSSLQVNRMTPWSPFRMAADTSALS